jgi:hypothetical protein
MAILSWKVELRLHTTHPRARTLKSAGGVDRAAVNDALLAVRVGRVRRAVIPAAAAGVGAQREADENEQHNEK